MRDDDIAFASLADISRRLAARRISATELVEFTLRRIEELNPHYNAIITLRPRALDEARAADRALARGKRSPLLGVPITIKDLILTDDAPTTAGSRIFEGGLESDHDAPVVRKLKRAGAIIVGKNNLHELALGVTNLNEHFGPARNPWDPNRVPGGSSGGSAVAVAAGMGYGSVGSDTRGSIRIPAACCGITGLKPTYGLVSTADVIPLAWSLDHVGPMTRSAEDAALMLEAMTGRRASRAKGKARKLKIGVCEYFMRDLDPEIERAVAAAIELFRKARWPVAEVSIPELDGSHGSSSAITQAEALTYHDETMKEHPDRIGPATRGRLENGYKLTALDLVRAERHREQVKSGFARAFEQVDCLLGATVPAPPAEIGKDGITIRGRETTLLAEYPRLTAPANLSGTPALSVPCGFTRAGLPIGLQLMADNGRDDLLFAAGNWYQGRTDWHSRRPQAVRD